MAADNVPGGEAQTSRFADMRYVGQGYTLEVPVPPAVDIDAIESVLDEFHATHDRIYGHAHPGALVEFVNLRLVQEWGLPQPQLLGTPVEELPDAGGSRQAYFEELGGYVETPVLRRAQLKVGEEIVGPAIIEQPDTTLVIYPEQRAALDDGGNVLVSVPTLAEARASAAVLR
jgi:N-methylhydantoinase A